MPPVNEVVPQHDIQVERFRRSDFEDLEAWAAEVGISTDQLAEQILKKAAHYLSQRGRHLSSNVVPFAPRR